MIGNVVVFNATLRFCCKDIVRNKYAMTELLRTACDIAGFRIRRIVEEDYRKPKGAKTLVAFLNESHAIVTTYPENKTIELEIAGCKNFNYEALCIWLREKQQVTEMRYFAMEKDALGNWTGLRNI